MNKIEIIFYIIIASILAIILPGELLSRRIIKELNKDIYNTVPSEWIRICSYALVAILLCIWIIVFLPSIKYFTL